MYRKIIIILGFCLCSITSAVSQSREEIVAFVLIGVEQGDKAWDYIVKSIKASSEKAIAIELEDDAVKLRDSKGQSATVTISENTSCVFDVDIHDDMPGRKMKYNFNNAYTAEEGFMPIASGGTSRGSSKGLMLKGKSVWCLESECKDFGPLAFMKLGEWKSVNERHKRAVDHFRSKYCPGRAY